MQKKQLEVKENLPGLYKYSDWLPVCRTLDGSGAPVTYKKVKGWPANWDCRICISLLTGIGLKKGALMKTGAFKECEAYAVCARINDLNDKVMVVASAGNTARAFARVCSEK